MIALFEAKTKYPMLPMEFTKALVETIICSYLKFETLGTIFIDWTRKCSAARFILNERNMILGISSFRGVKFENNIFFTGTLCGFRLISLLLNCQEIIATIIALR